MRIWVDLTNSPHVLVMRPVIDKLRERGHEVEVTARDFAQTLGLCERFGIAHTAIGRHRGGRIGAKARGLAERSLALTTLGARPALRPRARPRLQRHHDRRRAAAHPVRHHVRLRVGDRPAQRQLPAGRGRGGPRRDPARAALSLRRAGQDPRLPGPQGGVLPGRLRARPGDPRRPRPRPRRGRSRWSARRPRSRSITASRTTCSPACSSGWPACRRSCSPARRSNARSSANGRLHRPRARDRRPVADRLRGRRGVGRRHHEPRGGGARDAGLHGVRGPPRRRRRAPDRRGPAAAPDQPGRARRSSKRTDDRRQRRNERVRRDPGVLADLLLGAQP